MSDPGWYPDPAKVPGQLRYWDGHAWTEEVRDAEVPTTPASGYADGRRWLWGALAAVVAIALVVVLVIWRPFERPSAESPLPVPSRSVSAWDESEPPTPSPTSSPSESPSQPSPSPTGKCEQEAEPRDLEPVVANGRLSLGAMSMPIPAGWDGPVSEYTVYGNTAYGYELNVEGSWYNNLKIGLTNFATPRSLETQARLLVACLAEGSGMSLYTSPDKLTVSKVSVSGRPGVQVDAWFSWDVERLKTKGSLIRVIVVDTTDGPYYFLAEATKERTDVVKLAKKISTQLSVR